MRHLSKAIWLRLFTNISNNNGLDKAVWEIWPRLQNSQIYNVDEFEIRLSFYHWNIVFNSKVTIGKFRFSFKEFMIMEFKTAYV